MEGSNRENMQAADEHQEDSFTFQEESGWTFYLDDDEFFPRNEKRIQLSSSSCYDDTPSMISDADSLAPYSNTLGLLNKKKKKIKKKINSTGTDDPDDMEDTASSPVNSPVKVSSMKQYHRQMNSPRVQNQEADHDIEYSTSQQRRKGSMSGDHHRRHFSEPQLEEERNNRMGFAESNTTSNPRRFTDLKEKGLCVVPISMAVNYLK